MRKKIFADDEILIKTMLREGKNSPQIAVFLSEKHGYDISPRTIRDHINGASKKYCMRHPTFTACDCGVLYTQHRKCGYCKILMHDGEQCTCRQRKEYIPAQCLDLVAAIFDHGIRKGGWDTSI